MSTDSGPLSDNDSTMGNGAGVNGHANGFGNGSHLPMSEDEEMPLSQTVPPRRNLKRKKSSYAESSGEDDIPLASSPSKSASAAVAMPGAVAATTVPSSKVKSKRLSTKKEESEDDDYLKKPQKKKPARKKTKKEESSDDDVPIAATKPSARKRKAELESDPESSDEDKPIVKKAPAKKAALKKAKKEEDVEQSVPKPNGKAKMKVKDEGEEEGKGKGKKKRKKEEEEQEEVYRWWDADANGDGSVKWQTLEHNGVIFPPPYDPLPPHVKMKYNGKEVSLPLESEEVAGFYGALIESDHAKDAVFNKNFFNDWKDILKKHPPLDGIKITTFEKCDFRPMFDYFESEKAKKKALSASEKKELKKAKDEMELKYTTCLLDGRKEKVGNFRVEPPGLFRGRGEHPKKGSLKLRVRPEDITLNIGKDSPIPVPNMPGKWKSIQHDNTVTWLATWTENINQSHKYVFLAAGSSLKGQSDMMKFEKARELKNYVDRIRANYSGDLRSKVMAERQRATAMYFIDKLALRAGNEKGEDEADTVGCCSLRCEHVTLESPNHIIFDFLGKDSIRYYNRVAVDAQIFKNIRIFKENKEDDDSLFDRVTTASLNKHLNSEMKGLTAKVFRTYNASATFQRLLDETDLEGATLQEKLNAYNKANRLVAILCNHQRSVPKTHDQSMEKMRQKYKGLKYDRMKLRRGLFSMDSKYKKVDKYQEDESDLDDDWIVEYEEQLKSKEIEKAEKKFAKENEKLTEDDLQPQPDSVLEARIQHIEEEFKTLAKERGKTTVAVKGNKTPEKLMESIDKLTDRIKSFKLQMVDRDEGKEVALGTSKINYLDPRITASWCKIHDVPIEKLFSKTLQVKFPWAMEVDNEWKF
ncbi:DNA topoisomerase I [Lentinula aciculospora]|uniref:DNA topoisomerase I n=1 Tax=Lentinula aciculospora TaxID=153920 RepID=A0A9W9AIH6_9AGAR|nr:DNA topoisomerase I [Lentinula aciculospora]